VSGKKIVCTAGARAGETETAKTLPNTLAGAVCAQYRERNGNRYGPYFFRFWREGGRLRKVYVRRGDAPAAAAACRARRDRDARERRAQREGKELMRELLECTRQVEGGLRAWANRSAN
jgi:hypothetical protein